MGASPTRRVGLFTAEDNAQQRRREAGLEAEEEAQTGRNESDPHQMSLETLQTGDKPSLSLLGERRWERVSEVVPGAIESAVVPRIGSTAMWGPYFDAIRERSLGALHILDRSRLNRKPPPSAALLIGFRGPSSARADHDDAGVECGGPAKGPLDLCFQPFFSAMEIERHPTHPSRSLNLDAGVFGFTLEAGSSTPDFGMRRN